MQEQGHLFPQARTNDLVTKDMPDEMLVYDLKKHKAHCLNKTAAFVWNHCDGQTTVVELTRLMSEEFHTPVNESMVWHALDQLGKIDLLAKKVAAPDGVRFRSRRALLGKLGTAALLAVPLVMSISVPTAAALASIPLTCRTCRKKSDGACLPECAGLLGTCYGNAGCGSGQVMPGCVTCEACFGGADASVSWVVPGHNAC